MVQPLETPADPLSDTYLRELHVRASRALSELNGMLSSIPDSDILTETIPLQESRSSCMIENIVTSNDELFREISVGEGRSNADVRDVFRYRAALNAANQSDISVESIETICSILKNKPMHIRSRQDDRVHLVDSAGNIIVTPPQGNEVPDLLGRLIEDTLRSRKDPLVAIAEFHLLFETIHPFMDGNGRTGRILNETMVQKTGLLDRPVLHLSGFLIENRRDYYRRIRMVQNNGDWSKWYEFFFTGILESAIRVKKMVLAISESMKQTKDRCKDLHFFSDNLNRLLHTHVYIRVKNIVDAGIATRNTASTYLVKLESIGVLSSEPAGKGRIYINTALLNIISSFSPK